MLTSLRPIGNSRGVLIPAAYLASCQMDGEVDMQLQDGQIILRPAKRAPRAGWFERVTDEATSPELRDWADLPPAQASDDQDWVW